MGLQSAASRPIGEGMSRVCMLFVSADLSPLISRLRDSFPPRGSLLYAVRTWQIWLCIVDCLCDSPSSVAYATNCSQFSSPKEEAFLTPCGQSKQLCEHGKQNFEKPIKI